MGALGLPLLGDTMYEALAARAERHEKQACHSSISSMSTAYVQPTNPVSEEGTLLREQSRAAEASPETIPFSTANRWLNEPGCEGIGLQACKLVVNSELDVMGSSPATFEAKTPWWRW